MKRNYPQIMLNCFLFSLAVDSFIDNWWQNSKCVQIINIYKEIYIWIGIWIYIYIWMSIMLIDTLPECSIGRTI